MTSSSQGTARYLSFCACVGLLFVCVWRGRHVCIRVYIWICIGVCLYGCVVVRAVFICVPSKTFSGCMLFLCVLLEVLDLCHALPTCNSESVCGATQ